MEAVGLASSALLQKRFSPFRGNTDPYLSSAIVSYNMSAISAFFSLCLKCRHCIGLEQCFNREILIIIVFPFPHGGEVQIPSWWVFLKDTVRLT